MSEIRNLTRNGETFYPLTTSSAVINEDTGEGLIIDEVPTINSHNLVKSGGVYSEERKIEEELKTAAKSPKIISGETFDVTDENGYSILRIEDGNLKTKNFDSSSTSISKSAYSDISVENSFNIVDDENNVVFRIEDGDLKTKNFDSTKTSYSSLSAEDGLNIIDNENNVVLKIEGGHIKTKNFDSRTSNVHNVLSGKKISILGDSISTFCYTLAQKGPFSPEFPVNGFMGCSNVHQNYVAEVSDEIKTPEDTWWGQLAVMAGAQINFVRAIGSAAITDYLEEVTAELYSEGPTGTAPDVIFIMAGTNDYNKPNSLGTMTDFENGLYTGSNKTFYGCYTYVLSRLRNLYPNARVVCLSPLSDPITNQDCPYLTLNELSHNNKRVYADAIKEIASNMDCSYIDLMSIININRHNYLTYMYDGGHPRKSGMTLIAQAIFNNINNIIV